MPVLSLACHLPHNTPNIPSRYNNEQTTKQTKAINNSYIYISCKCDTNRAGHFTFDAYASRPVAWSLVSFAGFRACLIYMCLTVYEFSFILLIHHIILLILIFVLSVTFWTLTYYKIWILLIIYCFIWNYWIIYFVTCLEVFWSVMS